MSQAGCFLGETGFQTQPFRAGEIAQKNPWVLVQLGSGPQWVPAAAEQRTKVGRWWSWVAEQPLATLVRSEMEITLLKNQNDFPTAH